MKKSFKKIKNTLTAVIASAALSQSFIITEQVFCTDNDTNFLFEDNGSSISVTGCSRSAVNIEIPPEMNGKPVTDISVNAFWGCADLRSVTIPNTVTYIGANAFGECPGLSSVEISSGVEVIEEYAFYNCPNLTSVNIPEGVTEIGWSAFAQCKSLADVTIPSTIQKIGYNAFADTPWLEAVYKKDHLLIFNDTLFSAKETEWKPTVPGGVKHIAESAFESSEYLKRITLPDSLETIGKSAFSGANYLSKITIPSNVSEIGEGAFNDCIAIKSINIPPALTEIKAETFSYCSRLEYMFIPDNIRTIGRDALASCMSLEYVTIDSPDCVIFDSPSTISSDYTDDHLFSGTIYGYEASTAQEYAEKYNIDFRLIGDVNYDNSFNIADLVSCSSYLLGGNIPEDLTAADKDGNRVIDVYDMIKLRKQLVDHNLKGDFK